MYRLDFGLLLKCLCYHSSTQLNSLLPLKASVFTAKSSQVIDMQQRYFMLYSFTRNAKALSRVQTLTQFFHLLAICGTTSVGLNMVKYV